jgi:hypothetical protein
MWILRTSLIREKRCAGSIVGQPALSYQGQNTLPALDCYRHVLRC